MDKSIEQYLAEGHQFFRTRKNTIAQNLGPIKGYHDARYTIHHKNENTLLTHYRWGCKSPSVESEYDLIEPLPNQLTGYNMELSNEQIHELINCGNQIAHGEASNAIRSRILKTGVTVKQANAAMYYAYERGHSAGYDEVLRMALNLCSEVFEAAN